MTTRDLSHARDYADALALRCWYTGQGSLADLELIAALVAEVVELRQRVAMMEMEAEASGEQRPAQRQRAA